MHRVQPWARSLSLFPIPPWSTHQAAPGGVRRAAGRVPRAAHLEGEDVWDARLAHHGVEEGLHRGVWLQGAREMEETAHCFDSLL